MGDILLKSVALSPMVLAQGTLHTENKQLHHRLEELSSQHRHELRAQYLELQDEFSGSLERMRHDMVVQKALHKEELRMKNIEIRSLVENNRKLERANQKHRHTHYCHHTGAEFKQSLAKNVDRIFYHILDFVTMSYGIF